MFSLYINISLTLTPPMYHFQDQSEEDLQDAEDVELQNEELQQLIYLHNLKFKHQQQLSKQKQDFQHHVLQLQQQSNSNDNVDYKNPYSYNKLYKKSKNSKFVENKNDIEKSRYESSVENNNILSPSLKSENLSSVNEDTDIETTIRPLTVEEAEKKLSCYVLSKKNIEEDKNSASVQVKTYFNKVPIISRNEKMNEFEPIRDANNFIKASFYMDFILPDHPNQMRKRIIDIGMQCGKDIPKYSNSKVQWVIGVDIAAMQLVEAEKRWKNLKMPFPAAFVCVDASEKNCFEGMTVELHSSQPERKKGEPRQQVPFQAICLNSGCVDVVSCQMTLQHIFVNAKKTENFLENVSNLLRKDGLFIGSMPDLDQIQIRLEKSKGCYKTSYINIVCEDWKNFQTYTPYEFTVTEGNFVLTTIEYGIGLTDLISLCASKGLRFVTVINYNDYLKKALLNPKFRELRNRMNIINPYEAYSTYSSSSASSAMPSKANISNNNNNKVTANLACWDAISLNKVFCFRKV